MKENPANEEIIAAVRVNAVTMIAVDCTGVVRRYLSLSKIPDSTVTFSDLINPPINKSCAVFFVSRDKKFNQEKLARKIKDCVQAFIYSKTHKLKPGVNIPES